MPSVAGVESVKTEERSQEIVRDGSIRLQGINEEMS